MMREERADYKHNRRGRPLCRPVSTVLQFIKNRRAMPKYPLSFRDQFANWLLQSASPVHRTKTYCRLKDNGFPRRFAPRNDRGGVYTLPCLLPIGNNPRLATPSSPERGAKSAEQQTHPPRAPPTSPLSQQSARHKTAAGACIINMRARDAPGHIAYCTIRGAQFIHICTK